MTLSAKLVPTSGCLMGAWVSSSCVAGANFATRFHNFEAEIGRTPSTSGQLNIVHHYDWFPDLTTTFPPAELAPLLTEGRLALINWTPKSASGSALKWADISAGLYDAQYIDPTAHTIANYGQTIFLAFHTEMNADSSAQGGSWGTDAEYATAAQHVHDRFALAGATNVVWVFNPTGYVDTLSRMNTLYPGDAYVDWLGYDPYGNTSAGDTFAYVFGTKYPYYAWGTGTHATYNKAGSHTMPFMLCEWGKSEVAGQPNAKATFFTDLEAGLKTGQAYSQIRAHLYFNSTTTTGDCVETSTQAKAGFATLAQDGFYNPDMSPTPPPAAGGAFRAAASTAIGNASSVGLVIPSVVQAGDGMLLLHGCTRTGLRNAGEGTNAANVTTGNSNSVGSNPADNVTGTAPTYDTSQKHAGTSSMHASLTAGTDCHFDWIGSLAWPGSGVSYYGRTYFRRSAAPSAIARIYEQNSAANANQWGLGIDTAGKIVVRDNAAAATRATSTNTPAINTWHRAEWKVDWDGSKTTVTVRLFLGGNVDATSPDETMTSTAFTQAAAPGRGKFGLVFGASNTYDVYLDDWGLDLNGWLGPSGTSAVLTDPSGWTALDINPHQVASGAAELVVRGYRRTAAAGDPGSTVTLATDVKAHGSALLVAYSAVDQLALIDVDAAGHKNADGTTVVTPNVTSTGSAWIVSAWFDRSTPGVAANSAWTLPGGETQRAASYGTGTDGRVAGLVTDDAVSHVAGTYGTKTATANVSSYLGVAVTLAVKVTAAGGTQHCGFIHQPT